MPTIKTLARVSLVPALVALLTGCVSHRLYNDEPHEYIQTLAADDEATDGVEFDLAIIEFDDHGTFWKREQLEDTIALIERRSAESERGILVIPFVHGWKNNADPAQTDGNLPKFRDELSRVATVQAAAGEDKPEHVVGVYFGWRGATSRLWLQEQLTFWDRRRTAERLASLNMREAMFRIMRATDENERSKCFIAGHSMGGLIVGKTLAPSLTTMLLADGDDGVRMPADLVVLLNPALEALASWQFIDFLKRSGARAELRLPDGTRVPAPGPFMVSITSEADAATGRSYPLGRTLSTLTDEFRTDFRTDDDPPRPSQRYLATHAEGHVDYLVSHRAWVDEDGEVVLERVPGAWNDTPFWVVRVTRDISADHNDTKNPRMGALVDRISQLNRVYEAGVQTWMLTGDEPGPDEP